MGWFRQAQPTARLRKLEAHGIVERVLYQERPPRREYHLTELGWSLHPVVTVLREWGDAHLAGDDGPPATFRHVCGHTLHTDVVCTHCGEAVRPDTVRVGR